MKPWASSLVDISNCPMQQVVASMQPETSGLRVAVGVTPDPAWLSGDPTTTAPFWILSCLHALTVLIGHLDGIGLCGLLSDAFSKWKLCLVDLISTYHTLQILKNQSKGSPCQCLSKIPA